MDSPCIKQTACKVLKIFQYGKYLVAYVLKGIKLSLLAVEAQCIEFKMPVLNSQSPVSRVPTYS